ncbi:MAG: hypothetical protein U0798_05655 [Gemmataceae bacterium]
MARSRTVEAPASADVYFGMVFFSFLAVLTAVGLLAWELTSFYSWETTPPALAAPNLPKVPERVKPAAQAMIPVEEKPLASLTPTEAPAPKPATTIVEPAPIPSVLTVKPAPAAATPTPAVPQAPAQVVPTEITPAPPAAPAGPRPGFQIPRR